MSQGGSCWFLHLIGTFVTYNKPLVSFFLDLLVSTRPIRVSGCVPNASFHTMSQQGKISSPDDSHCSELLTTVRHGMSSDGHACRSVVSHHSRLSFIGRRGETTSSSLSSVANCALAFGRPVRPARARPSGEIPSPIEFNTPTSASIVRSARVNEETRRASSSIEARGRISRAASSSITLP